MVSRIPRARRLHRPAAPGGIRLIFAKLIVTLENGLHVFARPLLLAGFFIAFAWLGLFSMLYPWTHLAALVFFTVIFCDAIGKARAHYRPLSGSAAKRRLEEASGLKHRPLDVLDDRPIIPEPEQQALWQAHVAATRKQLKNLRWPRFKLTFADRDPYALRYALLILLAIGCVFSWGVWGGRLLSAINPALGQKMNLLAPTLDAWITPPEYTGLPPIMIATPAGARHDGDVIEVPQGSTITAHLMDKGAVPGLIINGQRIDFTANSDSDFEASQTITGGDRIAIRRGWQDLGSWHIRVITDQPPQIVFSEPPAVTERKTVRLAYEAKDDYGVKTVTAKITPRESLPGASNDPLTITLAAPDARDVKRVSFEDLTPNPWAGLPVQIQLFASDAAGHVAHSEVADFILPERTFFHPLARALIEERKRILQSPDDDSVRDEVANMMASIAHQPSSFHNDPLVLMALRSGAVRLVLDRGRETIAPVSDILWQTATRIEDGSVGVAEDNLRRAQKDLADALDRGASEQEIQNLIDRLHQALAQYLAQLAAQMAQQPQPPDELQQVLGPATNMLTPQDLDRLLEQMRNLSASGSREAARAELSKLQQLLENLRTAHPQITDEQRQMLKRVLALRELSRQQQQLLDQTFRASETADKQNDHKLAAEQEQLRQQLKSLTDQNEQSAGQSGLKASAAAMAAATGDLQSGAAPSAVQHQTEALGALQQSLQDMTDNLRAAMMMLPQPGMEQFGGRDPFGRGNFGGLVRDDGSVQVPDHMQAGRVREILDELERRAGDSNRPKTERDYIERLLQNF